MFFYLSIALIIIQLVNRMVWDAMLYLHRKIVLNLSDLVDLFLKIIVIF